MADGIPHDIWCQIGAAIFIPPSSRTSTRVALSFSSFRQRDEPFRIVVSLKTSDLSVDVAGIPENHVDIGPFSPAAIVTSSGIREIDPFGKNSNSPWKSEYQKIPSGRHAGQQEFPAGIRLSRKPMASVKFMNPYAKSLHGSCGGWLVYSSSVPGRLTPLLFGFPGTWPKGWGR